MKFRQLNIPDVVMVEPDVFEDQRGVFMEIWHAAKFKAAGIEAEFVQVNHSSSAKSVLRGLHYQIKKPQGKLVRVLRGEVFDVAVDLRRSSPTFGDWIGERLSSSNRRQLWVPVGFAHGFLALTDDAEVLYMCTDNYEPKYEHTLLWSDAQVGIKWPIPEGKSPILSIKDGAGSTLSEATTYA